MSVNETVGNMAAMSEALVKMTDWMEKHTAIFSVQVSPREEDPDEVEREKDEAISLARAALSAPPRNCDVGNPDEQSKRFAELCTSYSKNGARGICDDKCPFGKEYGADCALYWAQMPYTEGGKK